MMQSGADLRVLFYEDPLTDNASFFRRSAHLGCDAPWLRALTRDGHDPRMLVHERFLPVTRKVGVPRHAVITISEDELVNRLWNPHGDVNTLLHRHFDPLSADAVEALADSLDRPAALATRALLADALEKALGDFQPDIIITWCPAPHLRVLFPNALILHKETSIFSRPPLPLTYTLDPRGFDFWSVPAQPTEPASTSDQATMDATRELRSALELAYRLQDTAFSEIEDHIGTYETSLLVVGHENGAFFFDASCSYRSQVHQLLDVLENAPPHWAVVASEHPDCRRMTPAEKDFIKERHPNFIPIPEALAPLCSGQRLVRRVDRVAAVSSSVGLHALFWGTPLHALGHSHLNRFAAGQGVASLAEGPRQNAFTDGNAAWWAFHYSYPNSLAEKPGWLSSHLRTKLDHWQAHGVAGYFAKPIADMDQMRSRLTGRSVEAIHARLGPPLGLSAVPDRLDFTNAAWFGPGWAAAETNGELVYRWTTSREAELILPLPVGHDVLITIQVGTHGGCSGQTAELRLGDLTLAAEQVGLDGAARLTARLSKTLIVDPATRLVVRAQDLAPPSEGATPLALISTSITIEAAPPLPSRPAIGTHVPPRHSVLIPTLNGRQTLEVVLPGLLSRIPDGVEVVVSDNHSEDGTWEFLNGLGDERLTVLRPPERVDYASNADWAYRHARGEWLGHLGDDDQILSSRFAMIDHVASHSDAEMIYANRIRYYWPSFLAPELANTLDSATFSDTVVLMEGDDVARRSINSGNVRHTGAVVLHRNLIRRVQAAMGGRFMVQRLGEYLGYRVAAGLSAGVAFVNRPIVVIGRHDKSIGTSMHHDSAAGTAFGTDLERDIGSHHQGTGFHFLGQQPFSFEAALAAASTLAPRIGPCPIDYALWRERVVADLASQVAKGRISPDAAAGIQAAGDAALAEAIGTQTASPGPIGTPVPIEPSWGWRGRLGGGRIGAASITEVGDWFEDTFALRQSPTSLGFKRSDEVPVSWVDA